jgi:hypothetical protein
MLKSEANHFYPEQFADARSTILIRIVTISFFEAAIFLEGGKLGQTILHKTLVCLGCKLDKASKAYQSFFSTDTAKHMAAARVYQTT